MPKLKAPPLAEFGGKCLNQPHASSSALPTSPILTLMKRTMINDGSNNIKLCCDRDTILSLRLRGGFQHLLDYGLVATPTLLMALRTPRVRETLQLHLLEKQHQYSDISHEFDRSTCPCDFLEQISNSHPPVIPLDTRRIWHLMATLQKAENGKARIVT
jgi:hypothetical protein